MSTSLRVKGTVNGVETIYLGSYYEKSGSTIKTYYYAGGTRVAMNETRQVTKYICYPYTDPNGIVHDPDARYGYLRDMGGKVDPEILHDYFTVDQLYVYP